MVALRREGAGGLEGLAAARDPRQGVRHAQGGPRDHRGVALVGLGLAGEQARGAAGGEPGQVGDPEPRGAGPPHGEGPYVAELVDDDERAGGRGGEQRVELGLPVADGGAGQHPPSRSIRQAQCDDLPTSRPSTAAGLVDGAFTVVSFR